MVRRIDLIPGSIKLMIVLTYDLFAICSAFFLSYFIRVGFEGIQISWALMAVFSTVAFSTFVLFHVFDMYNSIVRYFNAKAFLRVQSLLIVTTVIFYISGYIFEDFVPRSVPIAFLVLSSVMIAGARALVSIIVDKKWFD